MGIATIEKFTSTMSPTQNVMGLVGDILMAVRMVMYASLGRT
jgi:hypothetical protein